MPPSEPADNSNQTEPSAQPAAPPVQRPENAPLPQTETVILPPKPNYKKPFYFLLTFLILVAAAGGAAYWFFKPQVEGVTKSDQTSKPAVQASIQGLKLDESKNYGDKYAGGLLPVGDGNYETDTAKAGYVFSCGQYTQNLKTAQ